MGSGKGVPMKLATMTILATVVCVLAAGCAEDGSAEDGDGGDQLESFNNVNGYCSAQPQSCDDLVPAEGEGPEPCCFGDYIYKCEGGTLLQKDCAAGCYNSSEGSPFCGPTSSGTGENGGWQDPPTDPGPGF